MSALTIASKMNREDITVSGCLMGAAVVAKCFGYNWTAAGFATASGALLGTSFFAQKKHMMAADIANLFNEISSAQRDQTFAQKKDNFIARYLQLQQTAPPVGSTEHTYLVAVFNALNNSTQLSAVTTEAAGAAVARTQNAAQTAAVAAAHARAALPQVETRGYYHQFNIHQNQYPATKGHFQNVPNANQGCSSMSLCLLDHLRRGLPVDSYNLDYVLAKGARMDALVRRALEKQTNEGICLIDVFPKVPAGYLPAIQSVENNSPVYFALDLDKRIYAANVLRGLTSLIQRNPANKGPLSAILIKNGHFISLYIDRENGVLKGIYLMDTRNAFDNGVVPSQGPQGVVFQPLGKQLDVAAQKMVDLLPVLANEVFHGKATGIPISMTEVVFKPNVP